jgi:hypothetical protein
MLAALVAGAASEIVAASVTRPFTWPADSAVAIAIVAFAAAGARRLSPLSHQRADREDRGARIEQQRWGLRWAVWVGPLAAALAWELFSYAASPRAAHPTLSYMLDNLDAHGPGRAAAFGAWLWVGWYLVTR